MTALAAAVFVSSLLGSLHCAGMCGPLVAVYAGGGEAARAGSRWLAHAAYSAGRLAAYAALGATAGALGATVDRAGAAWVGLERGAAVFAGAFIALWGLHALLVARGVKLPALAAPRALSAALARGLAVAGGLSAPVRAALLGLLSALLPCGWLWAFVITAAGSGSAGTGAVLMAVFWTGTLPVMLSVGEAVRVVAGPMRRHVPTVCAVLLMVLGLWAVVGRANLVSGSHDSGAAGTPACHAGR